MPKGAPRLVQGDDPGADGHADCAQRGQRQAQRRKRDEPPPGWRDAKRWMWRVLTWRQTALVLVNASAGFLVFFLITAALTAFVCSLRLAAGLGVRIGGERIVLAGPHPAWATIALSLLAVACNVLLVYALVACALAQAWVSRGLFRADTEAMERQITLLSQRNLGLVEAFEAERQRIERELHDGAQQHLASAAIQLGLAQAGLAGRSAADGHLEAAHGEVEAASAAMRRALAGLRPRTLLERGLGADISEMAEGAPISVSPPSRRASTSSSASSWRTRTGTPGPPRPECPSTTPEASSPST